MHQGQLCVGPTGQDGTVACGGDSGGPLTTEVNGQSFLLGLVSYGSRSCGPNVSGLDIYTDVGFFNVWIGDRIAVP